MRPATDGTVANWGRRLQDVKEVTVHHVVISLRRAPFATAKPCFYRDRKFALDRHLNRDWARRLVSRLVLPTVGDSNLHNRRNGCGFDSSYAPNVRLSFGSKRDPLDVAVAFDQMVVSWTGDSSMAWTPIADTDAADSLLSLLRAAVPDDAVLASLKPCSVHSDSMPPVQIQPWLVTTLPEAVNRVPPSYPVIAQTQGVSGTVWIMALIGKDGGVRSTQIEKSIPELDAEAVRAVEQWTFDPARSDAGPVPIWVLIPVKFTLK